MVAAVGFEPTSISATDFESVVSSQLHHAAISKKLVGKTGLEPALHKEKASKTFAATVTPLAQFKEHLHYTHFIYFVKNFLTSLSPITFSPFENKYDLL